MLTLSEIAARDLDIPIVGQLPLMDLSFGNAFEPSAMEIIRFEATVGRGAFAEKELECATVDPHHAFILTDGDAERHAAPFGVPPSILREREEHR